MSSNNENEAHKAGEGTGEKTASDQIYETVTDAANSVLETTHQVYDQLKEAVNPTPKPKTTGEKVGEAIDNATAKVEEYYKEVVDKAVPPPEK